MSIVPLADIEFQAMIPTPTITIGDQGNGSLKAIVYGTEHASDVYEKCEAEFPIAETVRISGIDVFLFRGPIRIEQQEALDVWHVSAKYSMNEPRTNDRKNATDPNQPLEAHRTQFDITFDIGTQTRHVKYALEHIAEYGANGQVIKSYNGAINVENGKPLGAEVQFPVMSFSETHYLPNSVVDNAAIDSFYDLVGTVNNATCRGFDAGELLLTQISGARRNDEQWQINYTWAVQRNLTNESINGATVTKKGWHYMWEEWWMAIISVGDGGDGKTHVPKLRGYHVDRIYPEKDHTTLPGVDA